MGPPQYQGEVHAVKHLRNAVLGGTWANDVLRAMNPQTISFSEFGTSLHRALLRRDELNAIAATHKLGHAGSSGRYRRASPANTLYQNQGTNGKPRTPGSTSCYALLRMRPVSISWAECSVVLSCGKFDYDKSG
jgi:hypothetical protein